MKNLNSKISEYRFERKFFNTILSKYEVEHIVKMNSAIFSEIFYQRFVNNIYFDSFNHKNYFENIDGSSNRIKVRVRWYGELFGYIKKPVLEIKIRNGLLGKKISFHLEAFILNNQLNMDQIIESIRQADEYSYLDWGALKASLINRYSRKYYMSADGKYRITIDSDQSFYEVRHHNNLFINKKCDRNSVILELKYDQKNDSMAKQITAEFPFRLTKSSKYVNGLENIPS